jgi:uncharacterized SAM-binding protein YcdF (DUF218 family)
LLTLRSIGLAGLVALLALCFTPVTDVVGRWLAKAPHRVEPADAIVVLGSGIREDGTLADSSLRRALHGIELYRRALAGTLVFTGPRNRAGFTEALVRARLAREMGVPPSAILVEATALTTREEAERVATVLRARGMSRILLVMDVEGVRRAAGLFERQGFHVVPSPALDVSNGTPGGRLHQTRLILIELLALVYYHAAGYL